MPIMIGEGEGDQFAPLSEGLHEAICVDVIELGEVEFEGYEKKHKVAIIWQVEEQKENGQRFEPSKWYNRTLAEGAKLREHLEQWRGRPFSEADLEAIREKRYDLEKINGQQAQLQIFHKLKKGRVYAEVESVLPPAKKQQVAAVDYQRSDRYLKYAPDAAVVEAVDEAVATMTAPAMAKPPVLTEDDIPF